VAGDGIVSADTCTDCGADLHKAAEMAAGICVECYAASDPIRACTVGHDDWPDLIEERVSGRSETPCPCGQAWDLIRGRCLACWAGADPRAAGLWRSVAVENVIDDRETLRNDAAEREEERERDEAEWAAEQGEEITVEVSW
jgi:hypothetical protein